MATEPARTAAENAVPSEPTKEQVQFARAVHITLSLWPALRKAVLEEWGGHESEEKRDYLLSFLCDEYGDGGKDTKPTPDDVADLIEDYVMKEYDCELDDESADWVAAQICSAHKAVFEEEKGEEILSELEKYYTEITKHKLKPTQNVGSGSDSDDDVLEHGDEADTARTHTGAVQREHAPQPEPIVDEDGFETVVSRRRR
ncbi:rRNA accumulation- protein [Malassezia vespertilionis]|uniref:Pre-rRNA-processing protein TSR2 n=1 Tax=Malassezia vespertilionis TaxID=2020962 RepID=A0A2N1JEE4_9BASI|nr:rRNA accumulation- protein [Malassezia vespertilionis]PKI84921.1 hypothetical protein MVES_001076 [Malassezia vespertilionis]WFD05808.1 rRNA accumulation- protein [Malassezia vespertilionis]